MEWNAKTQPDYILYMWLHTARTKKEPCMAGRGAAATITVCAFVNCRCMWKLPMHQATVYIKADG